MYMSLYHQQCQINVNFTFFACFKAQGCDLSFSLALALVLCSWVAGLRAAVFVCREDCRLLAAQKEAHTVQRAERKMVQQKAKAQRRAKAESIVGKYRDRRRS